MVHCPPTPTPQPALWPKTSLDSFMGDKKPAGEILEFTGTDYKPPTLNDGDFEFKTVKKATNVAGDWVPPRKASKKAIDRKPRMRSSAKALKTCVNDSNLKTHWHGKELGDKFWVPSKGAVDSSTMRMLASKEFPMSTVEYRDADIFACGSLPSQFCPPKRDAIHLLHPPDLVDQHHPNSLKQYTRQKYEGKDIEAWDSTVRDTVGKKLWRLRESVK